MTAQSTDALAPITSDDALKLARDYGAMSCGDAARSHIMTAGEIHALCLRVQRDAHAAGRASCAVPDGADAKDAQPLHHNHLPDLRYVLKVLQGAHVPKHQHGDVQAAITGMRYIIKRTEEAAQASPQTQEKPE